MMLSQEAATQVGPDGPRAQLPAAALPRTASKSTSPVSGIVSLLISHRFPALFKVKAPGISPGGTNFGSFFLLLKIKQSNEVLAQHYP